MYSLNLIDHIGTIDTTHEGSIKFSSTSFPNRLLKTLQLIYHPQFYWGITKSSPALSLPIGEISLVLKTV